MLQRYQLYQAYVAAAAASEGRITLELRDARQALAAYPGIAWSATGDEARRALDGYRQDYDNAAHQVYLQRGGDPFAGVVGLADSGYTDEELAEIETWMDLGNETRLNVEGLEQLELDRRMAALSSPTEQQRARAAVLTADQASEEEVRALRRYQLLQAYADALVGERAAIRGIGDAPHLVVRQSPSAARRAAMDGGGLRGGGRYLWGTSDEAEQINRLAVTARDDYLNAHQVANLVRNPEMMESGTPIPPELTIRLNPIQPEGWIPNCGGRIRGASLIGLHQEPFDNACIPYDPYELTVARMPDGELRVVYWGEIEPHAGYFPTNVAVPVGSPRGQVLMTAHQAQALQPGAPLAEVWDDEGDFPFTHELRADGNIVLKGGGWGDAGTGELDALTVTRMPDGELRVVHGWEIEPAGGYFSTNVAVPDNAYHGQVLMTAHQAQGLQPGAPHVMNWSAEAGDFPFTHGLNAEGVVVDVGRLAGGPRGGPPAGHPLAGGGVGADEDYFSMNPDERAERRRIAAEQARHFQTEEARNIAAQFPGLGRNEPLTEEMLRHANPELSDMERIAARMLEYNDQRGDVRAQYLLNIFGSQPPDSQRTKNIVISALTKIQSGNLMIVPPEPGETVMYRGRLGTVGDRFASPYALDGSIEVIWEDGTHSGPIRIGRAPASAAELGGGGAAQEIDGRELYLQSSQKRGGVLKHRQKKRGRHNIPTTLDSLLDDCLLTRGEESGEPPSNAPVNRGQIAINARPQPGELGITAEEIAMNEGRRQSLEEMDPGLPEFQAARGEAMVEHARQLGMSREEYRTVWRESGGNMSAVDWYYVKNGESLRLKSEDAMIRRTQIIATADELLSRKIAVGHGLVREDAEKICRNVFNEIERGGEQITNDYKVQIVDEVVREYQARLEQHTEQLGRSARERRGAGEDLLARKRAISQKQREASRARRLRGVRQLPSDEKSGGKVMNQMMSILAVAFAPTCLSPEGLERLTF
jgi:hypothetical protein